GTDKPFDATRKMLALIFPERALPVPADATGALAAMANKLDRVTLAGYLGDRAAELGAVIFLEGGATDEEYAKAAEAIAKAGEKKFATEKLGRRTLLVLGEGTEVLYGSRVSESLFVFASSKELLTEVFAKDAGEKKVKLHPGLADALKTVNP